MHMYTNYVYACRSYSVIALDDFTATASNVFFTFLSRSLALLSSLSLSRTPFFLSLSMSAQER